MDYFEILLVGIGLAMDAFAVSVCKGLSVSSVSLKNMIIVGEYFGIFQALMPMIGFFLGNFFGNIIVQIDHWVAFVLLGMIGFNMLKDSFSSENISYDGCFAFKTMFPLAVATSIDALTVGITFAFLKVNIFEAILIIGIVTFVMSMIGVFIGNRFGNKYGNKAQIIGGVILILMGCRILYEHLFI